MTLSLAVFIVQEPQFDGDYAIWSYGAPTGGVLSCKFDLISRLGKKRSSNDFIDGGGRNHHIHDIYVNFQR